MRGALLVVALGLAVAAVVLVVQSGQQRFVQLGVILGLWAAVLAAFALHDGRLRGVESAAQAEQSDQDGAGSGIEIRSSSVVERTDDVEARHGFEARLEQMLRREIQQTLGREVAALRAEITSLRGELLDKVGGQLRLERIETTRVIGSDLEALQHEVRALKVATDMDHDESWHVTGLTSHSVPLPAEAPASLASLPGRSSSANPIFSDDTSPSDDTGSADDGASETAYRGRRRRTDNDRADTSVTRDTEDNGAGSGQVGGRRHRRAADDDAPGADLLRTLLAREGAPQSPS